MIPAQWPSRAHGFLPIIRLLLFSNGYKNLDILYFPKSVNLPYGTLYLGFGLPITYKEFFIACEEVYICKYLFFSDYLISNYFSISALR